MAVDGQFEDKLLTYQLQLAHSLPYFAYFRQQKHKTFTCRFIVYAMEYFYLVFVVNIGEILQTRIN